MSKKTSRNDFRDKEPEKIARIGGNNVGEMKPKITKTPRKTGFHMEFLTASQKMAWTAFQRHDVLFISGVAGTGKSYMAMSFAINEIINGDKEKIVLTRPIVEAGESLGYLPGDFMEKVNPYMMPLYDALNQLVGRDEQQVRQVEEAIEIAPIAYLRGRSWQNAICILDEAQNCTMAQLKLFLTRFGKNSKIIVTGDPKQSDLGKDHVDFVKVMSRLESVPGIGIVQFPAEDVVRHPLIVKILEKLED